MKEMERKHWRKGKGMEKKHGRMGLSPQTKIPGYVTGD